MRKLIAIVLALALSSPICAQGTPKVTAADDDLKCAAWAAVVLGVNKDNQTVVASMTAALTWFLGHYEGETGKKFEDGLSADYIERIAPQLPAVETHCRERVQQMGGRMTDWGQKLQEEGKAAQAKSEAKPASPVTPAP